MKLYLEYGQITDIIVQGFLMHLAVNYRVQVWAQFRSWLRTMRPDLIPSELVVAQALRSSLPDYLVGSPRDCEVTRSLLDHVEVERMPGMTARRWCRHHERRRRNR